MRVKARTLCVKPSYRKIYFSLDKKRYEASALDHVLLFALKTTNFADLNRAPLTKEMLLFRITSVRHPTTEFTIISWLLPLVIFELKPRWKKNIEVYSYLEMGIRARFQLVKIMHKHIYNVKTHGLRH